MPTATASACIGTMLRLFESFREHMHRPPVKFPISPFHLSSIFLDSPTSKKSCVPMSVNWNFFPDRCPKAVDWNFSADALNNRLNTNRNALATTIPPTQYTTKDRSLCKVKLLISFDGKIMPSGDDGNMHYVGGQNRIIVIRRDVTIQEFHCKLDDAYGGPVRVCYQLPGQSLDTIVSVCSAEDLENMMEEFDYLSKESNHGSTKLRLFLFPPFDLENLPTRVNNEVSNVDGPRNINKNNEALTFEANTGKSHWKASNKHATSTLYSNVIGEGFINDALKNQSFPVHSNINDTRNEAIRTDKDVRGPQMLQQQPLSENIFTTSDSYSLFSDQDPWKVLGFQLSNINDN